MSRGQNFDCHIAIQLRIARAIDLTHPSRAQTRADFVTTEFSSGGGNDYLSGTAERAIENGSCRRI